MAKSIDEHKRTELGRRLVELRTKAELSQVQLAQAVGLPQRTIANYIPSSVLPSLADGHPGPQPPAGRRAVRLPLTALGRRPKERN